MDAPIKKVFGVMPDGAEVEQYTLVDGAMECEVITYGGALRALRVPGHGGKMVDVLLGFDRLEDYCAQDKYIGALIGRYANRIGGSSFELNGVRYPLAANDGPNHLHGGAIGFDKQVWNVESACVNTLVLSLESPDGQEGYPGDLSVRVTYRLENHGLTIAYWATCTQDTPCSMTNHAYFNLNGHDSGLISEQKIQIFADCYTPTDAHSIPTGELAAVADTPMDLRRPVRIGAHIDAPYEQLTFAGGFDHNWVINGAVDQLRPAAMASSDQTGITMEVLTTEPGIQFYSGNYLDGCPAGKGCAPYAKRWGFCLETQHFPDSPHHAQFPNIILEAGAEYKSTTRYQFLT